MAQDHNRRGAKDYSESIAIYLTTRLAKPHVC